MAAQTKKTFPGFLGGGILSLFGKSRVKPTEKNFRQMEFKSSTQRIGVSFTEKIRQVFRSKWMKKH